MPPSPDDLPRSATGRTPQWVVDQAAGMRSEQSGWRTTEPVPVVPAGRPRRRRRRLPVAVAVVVLAGMGVATWWSGGAPGVARDVVAAIDARLAPAPSADVVALADAAHLSDDGRNLFYGTRPQVVGAAAFAGRCVDPLAQGAMSAGSAVGCFLAGENSIVLYAPADPRLHWSVVEAAAHETLHAAWAGLSTAERDQLTPLLEVELAARAADDPIRERITASVGQHPEGRPTELFAYVGTTIWRAGGLDPTIEAVYARFVSDRAALAAVYTGGRDLLTAMSAEVQAASQAVADVEAANANHQAQLTADTASAAYYRQAYDTKVAEVAAMPARQRDLLRLGWEWWDGTQLPMAPATTTLSAAAALLARDESALPARAAALQIQQGSASAERARVQGLIDDLQALQAQLDPTGPAVGG
ncbi:MAG: hypothetical protein ACOH2F_11515 [Cellulomonas sp.]